MSGVKYWDLKRQMPPGREFEAYHFSGTYRQPMVYHSHPFYEFFFFIQGHSRLIVEGLDFEPSRGDVLIYPPGVMHRNIHLDSTVPYERFYLYASRDFLQSVSTPEYDIPSTLEEMTRDHHYYYHVEDDALDDMIRLTDQVIEGSDLPTPADRFINRCQFCTLLISALRMITSTAVIPQSDHSRGMSSLIRYIDCHATEPLSLDELADRYHFSKYYLLREFKSFTGTSVHQYLILRRILASQEMIRRGVKPKDACFECGFTDYSSYYRAFKSRVGLSPEQYRQSAAKG